MAGVMVRCDEAHSQQRGTASVVRCDAVHPGVARTSQARGIKATLGRRTAGVMKGPRVTSQSQDRRLNKAAWCMVLRCATI